MNKLTISIKLTILNKKRAPVYCFGEDLVLNSANVILASGNKCYASN